MNTTENTHTGYKVAKLVNKELQDRKLKEIPPQMVYHYIKKGMIPSVQVNGQARVTEEETNVWIAKYVEKRVQKSKEADEVYEETQTESDEVAEQNLNLVSK